MLPFAVAIFTGAFLLFQVQPLIGKYLLPWFGGGPGVWTTCLLFFQLVLLGGYAYAHLLTTRVTPRRQPVVHGVLLLAAAALLPIAPGEFWKQHVAGDPTWHLLLLLGGTIGLPYFVLSSTGPLLQQWFSTTNPGVSPYRLYALSNVASLLALLSYPVYFEVRFARQTQAWLWSAGFLGFVALCGYCAWRVRRAAVPAAAARPDRGGGEDRAPSPAPWLDRALWLALPAVASVLLLATTNKLCQEVAVIPFLWVLPLSLYLLSFVLCFDHARWYARGVFVPLLTIGVGGEFMLLHAGNTAPFGLQIATYTVVLFLACMVCHGELYRLKPDAGPVTGYYLAISAGGALGGVLVAVVAPAVFDDFRELPLGLWALTYLAGVLAFRQRSRTLVFGVAVGLMLTTFVLPLLRAQFRDGLTYGDELIQTYRGISGWLIMLGVVAFLVSAVNYRNFQLLDEWRPRLGGFVMGLSVFVALLIMTQWNPRRTRDDQLVRASRNFYGTLKVFEDDADDPANRYFLLLHGATTHGLQFAADDKAMRHTTYYGETSGVGRALAHLRAVPGQRRIGLVGLGTGTLASYGAKGDYLRIYDINPAVVQLAQSQFTYLRRCPAQVDIVLGDARLSMERELAAGQPQQFDLLALDAFSSDAIPVHLLTREAIAVYLRQLKPGGVLAIHTSNRYLDLEPVVERLAEEYGLAAAPIYDDDEHEWWVYRTTWILLTKDREFLAVPAIADVTQSTHLDVSARPLWTDDHASLFPILRR